MAEMLSPKRHSSKAEKLLRRRIHQKYPAIVVQHQYPVSNGLEDCPVLGCLLLLRLQRCTKLISLIRNESIQVRIADGHGNLPSGRSHQLKVLLGKVADLGMAQGKYPQNVPTT